MHAPQADSDVNVLKLQLLPKRYYRLVVWIKISIKLGIKCLGVGLLLETIDIATYEAPKSTFGLIPTQLSFLLFRHEIILL